MTDQAVIDLGTAPARSNLDSSTGRADSALTEQVGRARETWSRALASPELREVGRALDAAVVTVNECVLEAERVAESPETQHRLKAIHQTVVRLAPAIPPGAFERFVLGHAAVRFLNDLDGAPVAAVTKRLVCTGLLRFAEGRTPVDIGEHRFIALCKIATLRRFPAGQFDWEVSGLPRSWLPAVRPRSALVRLLWAGAARWRGFSPAFFIHMPVTHPVHALLEREALQAYYRMAQSLALQPDVQGLIASSWLHSPDTFAVSPHLAWMNRVFIEHGAIVATMGPASPDCGVLTRSIERQRAFEEGRFTPTMGLIVWPRRNMLAWAKGFGGAGVEG